MKKTFAVLSFAVLAALSVAACEYDVRTDDPEVSAFSPRPSRPAPGQSPSSSTSESGTTASSGPMLPPPNEEDAGAGDASAESSPTQCEGAPIPCDQLDLYTCGQQAGCGVDGYECSGVPTPCENLSKMYPCNQQYGCSWIPK